MSFDLIISRDEIILLSFFPFNMLLILKKFYILQRIEFNMAPTLSDKLVNNCKLMPCYAQLQEVDLPGAAKVWEKDKHMNAEKLGLSGLMSSMESPQHYRSSAYFSYTIEQGGRVIANTWIKEAVFMVHSYTKKAGLASLDRNFLCKRNSIRSGGSAGWR